MPGAEELLAGPSRNFQVLDPLDFLAEVTQHPSSPLRASARQAFPIPENIRSGTMGGTRTRAGGKGAIGNRQPPLRPARPRLDKPAKAGSVRVRHAQAGLSDQAGLRVGSAQRLVVSSACLDHPAPEPVSPGYESWSHLSPALPGRLGYGGGNGRPD